MPEGVEQLHYFGDPCTGNLAGLWVRSSSLSSLELVTPPRALPPVRAPHVAPRYPPVQEKAIPGSILVRAGGGPPSASTVHVGGHAH